MYVIYRPEVSLNRKHIHTYIITSTKSIIVKDFLFSHKGTTISDTISQVRGEKTHVLFVLSNISFSPNETKSSGNGLFFCLPGQNTEFLDNQMQPSH